MRKTDMSQIALQKKKKKKKTCFYFIDAHLLAVDGVGGVIDLVMRSVCIM
jgi:hypothetical protein